MKTDRAQCGPTPITPMAIGIVAIIGILVVDTVNGEVRPDQAAAIDQVVTQVLPGLFFAVFAGLGTALGVRTWLDSRLRLPGP